MTIAVEIGYTYGFVDYGPDHQKETIRSKDISSIDVFEIASCICCRFNFFLLFLQWLCCDICTQKSEEGGGYDRAGNNAAGENVYG